jgi:valyl-tRNA synthetase
MHQTRYKDIQQGYSFEESAKVMEVIIELITQVRKLKTEKQLSLKVPLAALTITATDQHLLHKVEGHTQLIRGITHAEKLHFKAEKSESKIEQSGDLWNATVNLG